MFSLSCISPAIFSCQNRSTELEFSRRRNSCNKNNFPSLNNPSSPSHPTSLANSGIPVSELHRTSNLTEDPTGRVGNFLQTCSNIEEIQRVHCFLVKSTVEPLVFVNNNLITAYAKYGDMGSARKVFDDMSERNIVSWTALLNGYRKNGFGNEALSLFTDFFYTSLHGNEQTYVCLLNLCSKTSSHELGRQIHTCVIKNQIRNFRLDSTILHFYAQCGDMISAIEVFERMERRDVIAWTTMITACSHHNLGQEAIAMLLQMLADGLNPNEFTLCGLLNACGSEKELSLGKQLHSIAIKKGFNLDVYIGTALMDMYAKCSKMDDSRIIFDAMPIRNVITWNSIIAGYAKNGNGEEALRLFHGMRRLKLSANDLTMVSLLRACGSIMELSIGKEVHTQIMKSFSPNNGFIGSELVWFYCKCKDYISASRVLHFLPEKTVASWTAMISGCSHLDYQHEALEYWNQMMSEGVKPNPFTYSSALKACAKLENVNQGKLIHSSINKTAAVHNVFVGSALLHMYSQCGFLSEAAQVFNTMPEKNLVSWRSMIVAYAKNGVCDEALKLVYRMQAEGFEVDDHIVSTVLNSCGEFMSNNEKGLWEKHRLVLSSSKL